MPQDQNCITFSIVTERERKIAEITSLLLQNNTPVAKRRITEFCKEYGLRDMVEFSSQHANSAQAKLNKTVQDIEMHLRAVAENIDDYDPKYVDSLNKDVRTYRAEAKYWADRKAIAQAKLARLNS